MSAYLFRRLTKNSNAKVVIHTYKPVCVELYKDYKDIGRCCATAVNNSRGRCNRGWPKALKSFLLQDIQPFVVLIV